MIIRATGWERSSVLRRGLEDRPRGRSRSASMYAVAPSGVLVSRARAWARTRGSLSTYTIRESGRDALGDLVGVVGGGQAGADVEELPDALLAGQVPDGAAEEVRGSCARDVDEAGEDRLDVVADLAVDGVVVLAAHASSSRTARSAACPCRSGPVSRQRRRVGGLGRSRECLLRIVVRHSNANLARTRGSCRSDPALLPDMVGGISRSSKALRRVVRRHRRTRRRRTALPGAAVSRDHISAAPNSSYPAASCRSALAADRVSPTTSPYCTLPSSRA